jgi:hypothetical protein
MTAATLPRVTQVPPLETVDATQPKLDPELHRKVVGLLGYTGGVDVNRTILHKRAQAEKKHLLYCNLIGAGIHPLEEAAVEHYKDRVIIKTWLKPLAVQIGIGVAWYATTSWIIRHNSPENGWAVAGLVVAIASAIIASWVTWLRARPARWEWDSTRLAGYTRPVPEHALSIALRTVEVLKISYNGYHTMNAYFDVEEFRYRERVADPFLVLHYDEFRVYLDVWDEPTF